MARFNASMTNSWIGDAEQGHGQRPSPRPAVLRRDEEEPGGHATQDCDGQANMKPTQQGCDQDSGEKRNEWNVVE
jgi:hypothetical protein